MGTDATLIRKQETNHKKKQVNKGEENGDEGESVPLFDKKWD